MKVSEKTSAPRGSGRPTVFLTVNELEFHLRRFGRRLRLRHSWLLAQRSLWLAALGGLVIQAVGHFKPIPNLWAWTLLPFLAWLLYLVYSAIFKQPSLLQIARRVDVELDLKERLSTAVALQNGAGVSAGPLVSMQRSSRPARVDAAHTAQAQPVDRGAGGPSLNLSHYQKADALTIASAIIPAQAFPLNWLPRSLGMGALLVSMLLVSVYLPNPQDLILAQQAAIQQAAKEQAAQIEQARQEIEANPELSPEMRQELVRQLEALAKNLQRNPGDLEQALAELTRLEQALQRKMDARVASKQAMLEALAAQLAQATGARKNQDAIQTSEQALDQLAQKIEQMDEAQRQQLAQELAQAAAQAGQSGDATLSQALASLAQAVQSGDAQAMRQASQDTKSALAELKTQMSDQAALQRALAQANAARQALAQTGRQAAQGNSAAQGSSGNMPGGSPAGGQRVAGGGTKANQLPPATGGKSTVNPRGNAPDAPVTPLNDSQVYAPWQKTATNGAQIFIPGQETQQGQTTSTERKNPLPGVANPALIPYNQVFYQYLNTAAQAMDQNKIPSNLLDYVRLYFSSIEP